jgi:predicted PurR-regulated permease PerM
VSVSAKPWWPLALGWAGVCLVLVLLLVALGPVLTPFLLALLLAYILRPLVVALQRRGLSLTLAVTMAELLLITLAVATLMLLVPILTKELPALRQAIPDLIERGQTNLIAWAQSLGIPLKVDVSALKRLVLDFLSDQAPDSVSQVLNSLRIGGSVAMALLGYLVLVPVVLFYVLADWDALLARGRHLLPPRWRPAVLAFLADSDATLGQYFRGQLSVMLSLAAYYSITLALAGLDLALPVGVFTGLAIFVPYLGYGLGLALALLAALLQFDGSYGVLAVAVIYGVGQLLESFVLTPRLVGERIGLSPLAVIFALLAFGHLLGFVGVLMALPASAVGLVALRRLKAMYLDSRLYRG